MAPVEAPKLRVALPPCYPDAIERLAILNKLFPQLYLAEAVLVNTTALVLPRWAA